MIACMHVMSPCRLINVNHQLHECICTPSLVCQLFHSILHSPPHCGDLRVVSSVLRFTKLDALLTDRTHQ